MKKRDILWCLLYLLLVVASAVLIVCGGFAWFNRTLPYLAGAVQFAVYATAGDLLSTRMLEGQWKVNRATAFVAASWGFSGLWVALAFQVFSAGAEQAMLHGFLPFCGNAIALAFFTSALNNLIFGPLHSGFIRVCTNYASLRFTRGGSPTVRQAVNSVDWGELIDFTLLKTIPFFWIPVNTITFLLPEEYRIASAAMLSMVFGILMTVLRLKERRDQASTAAQ